MIRPSSFTVNLNSDVFTSGASRRSFMVRTSSIKVTTLSVLCISAESTAAMNGAG
ncbi:hypothetical protein D3C71_1347000 [compost metagenome]